MDIKEVVQYIKQLRKENPDQIIIVETPDYHARMRLGDILVFESMGEELVFDNE